MNKIVKFTACTLILVMIIFIACKKELSCEGCKDNNKPPIANAGADQTITLPKDSISLDGTASTDPDGNITSYKWAKIAGPVSSNIVKPDLAKTVVKTLVAGVYKFELTVTDNGGLSAKDTVQIMVDAPGNQPPVACAGADQTITLPANAVTLDGSCSADPDNNIASYLWTKISGPAATITAPNAVQTQVTGLGQGTYQFELKVTDAGGLFSKDTVQVTVNPAPIYICGNTNRPYINAQLIPIGILSQTRGAMVAASAGNKILFAGGGGPSSRVDIYDLTTQTWSTAELSEARSGPAAVTTGNKIFFAGGDLGPSHFPTTTVDIYDVSTNKWTVSALSMRGTDIAGAAVGNKVLFGGGYGRSAGSERGKIVDVYDITSDSWSVASFSEIKERGHAAVTVNNKVYFSGGQTWSANPFPGSWSASRAIDVYDDERNSWSTSYLVEGKMSHAGIAANNKIFWAGGLTGAGELTEATPTCSVEIYDLNTGNVSIQTLSWPSYPTGVIKNNQIIFYGGGDKLIYMMSLLTSGQLVCFP